MNYKELEKRIDYKFKNTQLLEIAVTHSSYASENGKSYRYNNERLEFIGDAYLDAIIGAKLYDILPDEREGVLSKDRANIVCEKSLAGIGRDIGLGRYIHLGKGEEAAGGDDKNSILADALEALIGAVIIDGGFDKGKKLVLELFSENIRLAVKGELYRDYKTELQENLQSIYHSIDIFYRLAGEEGPAHNKKFTVEVYAHDKLLGYGRGKSKREAEQEAARAALYAEDLL